MNVQIIDDKQGTPLNVAQLIEILQKVPNQNAKLWFWESDGALQVDKVEYYEDDDTVCICGIE